MAFPLWLTAESLWHQLRILLFSDHSYTWFCPLMSLMWETRPESSQCPMAQTNTAWKEGSEVLCELHPILR